jgi:hypothetical protein
MLIKFHCSINRIFIILYAVLILPFFKTLRESLEWFRKYSYVKWSQIYSHSILFHSKPSYEFNRINWIQILWTRSPSFGFPKPCHELLKFPWFGFQNPLIWIIEPKFKFSFLGRLKTLVWIPKYPWFELQISLSQLHFQQLENSKYFVTIPRFILAHLAFLGPTAFGLCGLSGPGRVFFNLQPKQGNVATVDHRSCVAIPSGRLPSSKNEAPPPLATSLQEGTKRHPAPISSHFRN